MNTFVQVVSRGSFAAASEKPGRSRAQISKSVMQLEAHLGTRLLNRTTRKISLTETGRIYYDPCKTILQDIEEIEGIAGEHTSRHINH
ncbi:Transcriptional regulator, LysR family [hydrothermal vent metagenome]|uniref:Transcriptional regulator, LysR family n=1 Tax=hydrothermal vent metagenome TaxID=652676 RepID=A0A3B0X4B4_9ZZZZ